MRLPADYAAYSVSCLGEAQALSLRVSFEMLADFFSSQDWEIEHGTQEGILQHRKIYARKIDPVVNGICNMEKFVPITKIKSKIPTVTMLSHVRFVKDIKNALLAADIIVNEWGFKDYQLDIYGDMEKAPAYSVECKEILASKSLRDHVALKGLGNPSKVLEEAVSRNPSVWVVSMLMICCSGSS